LIRRTVSGGVTTTLFIPGSGTNISGFGVLMKMVPEDFERQIVRELGAMKVAQGFNPERRSGDMAATRMGSSWLLTKTLQEAKAYADEWHAFEQGKAGKPKLRPELEQLRGVADRKIPVLIHTAGARDIAATARMFQDVFHLWMILSHGCFNGHWAAVCCANRKTPVNLGPRNYEFKDSEFVGIPRAYWDVGVRDMSLNTDAPVVAPEQLQLQGAMAARLGLDYQPSLMALTLVPARQVGILDRVGTLEVGKDADFQVTAGDPLDPRFGPESVYIEGKLVYRRGDVR
jgi:imidazolonepropionase-like amidohydrolase